MNIATNSTSHQSIHVGFWLFQYRRRPLYKRYQHTSSSSTCQPVAGLVPWPFTHIRVKICVCVCVCVVCSAYRLYKSNDRLLTRNDQHVKRDLDITHRTCTPTPVHFWSLDFFLFRCVFYLYPLPFASVTILHILLLYTLLVLMLFLSSSELYSRSPRQMNVGFSWKRQFLATFVVRW